MFILEIIPNIKIYPITGGNLPIEHTPGKNPGKEPHKVMQIYDKKYFCYNFLMIIIKRTIDIYTMYTYFYIILLSVVHITNNQNVMLQKTDSPFLKNHNTTHAYQEMQVCISSRYFGIENVIDTNASQWYSTFNFFHVHF